MSGPAYWSPGETVLWRYTNPKHETETVRPVRVVRDDADGLVAWLAAGTPLLRPVLADGSDLRTVPVAERFDADLHGRANRLDCWHGRGILKVAPVAVPWSIWLFWNDEGFRGWYVNLESVHVRGDREVVSQDHVLDVVVTPDRQVHRKDEDELSAAVTVGRFTAAEAAAFEQDAADVEDVVRRWGQPFCAGWESWAADPTWPLPQLPPAYVDRANYR